MRTSQWREQVARLALLIALMAGIPLAVVFMEVPAKILAACGDYYSSNPPCDGCESGSTRPLCCILVRNKFHPNCESMCDQDPVQCGPDAAICPPGAQDCPCDASRGVNVSEVVGTPSIDGTTGQGSIPKYQSTSNEVSIAFLGYVRICPQTSGSLDSWICATPGAEVFLDERPLVFAPECKRLDEPTENNEYAGDNNKYGDYIQYNTTSAGWRNDGLCPREIGLAEKLQDNKWHVLKIVYYGTQVETPPGPFIGCCDQPNAQYFGITLYLGCGIKVRRWGLEIPRIAYPNKFSRVNLYGVPLPERSPTGEMESDEPKNGFFIDMYNLAPSASFSEVSVPIEGGELALEFRRDGGVRTAHSSASLLDLPITYPTDDLLGLGWNSNLSARAIISRFGGNCPDDLNNPPRVTITDAGGTTYQYTLEPGNKFRPEVYDSQSNSAIRATPSFAANNTQIVLMLRHGTKYVYQRVGTFIRPFGNDPDTIPPTEEYYRISYVLDRNGNKIIYRYLSGGAYPQSMMLVSDMHEEAHPERKLYFTYQDFNGGGNQNGYDWGIRLVSVRDPYNIISREIRYEYEMEEFTDYDDNPLTVIPDLARRRWLLKRAIYPQVENGDTGVLVSPVQHYEYELRVTKGSTIKPALAGQVEFPPSPAIRLLHVGISEAWQNDDSNSTRFTYKPPCGSCTVGTCGGCQSGESCYSCEPDEENPLECNPCLEEFPVALHPVHVVGPGVDYYGINVEVQPVMTLKSAQTAEGTITTFKTYERSVICEGECAEAAFTVRTSLKDARGYVIEYIWEGVGRPLGAPHDPLDPTTGFPFYGNRVGYATVTHSLTRNTQGVGVAIYNYSNDLFGNLVQLTDMSGNITRYFYEDGLYLSDKNNQPTKKEQADTINTLYEYGVYNKLQKVTDPALMVTRFTFDAKGNRIAIIKESTALGDSQTDFTYYTNGMMSSTIDPDGVQANYGLPVFDPAQLNEYYKLETVVDPNGLALRTTKIYDLAGNLRKEIPPEGNFTGNDPTDYQVLYEYDNLNRLIKVTKPAVPYNGDEENLRTSIERTYYDLKGNVVMATSPRKPDHADPVEMDYVATRFQYDAENRLRFKRIVMNHGDPDPNNPTSCSTCITTETRYDPLSLGLPRVQVDGRGFETFFEYDALLRPVDKEYTATVEGVDQQIHENYQYGDNSGSGAFSYTGGWNPIRVSGGTSFITDYKYDVLYRPTQAVRRVLADAAPDTPGRDQPTVEVAEPHEDSVYDISGNLIKKAVVLSTHDNLEVQATYTFYDDFNRPTIVVVDVDGDGSATEPAYHPELQRINFWEQFDGIADQQDLVTKTAYSKSGRVIATCDPEGNVSTIEYDGAGRPIRNVGPWVFNPATASMARPSVLTTYNANGAVIQIQGPYPDGENPSGKLVGYAYDAQGRQVRSIVDLNGDGILDIGANSADIVTKTFYDRVGNVVAEVDARGNATAIVYDKANRKTSVAGPSVATVEPQFGTVPITHYQYDDNSNVTLTQDARGVQTDFEYNSQNLLSVERKANQVCLDQLVTEKLYDLRGNLAQLRVLNRVWDCEELTVPPDDLQVTHYQYDELNRLTHEEFDGSGTSRIFTYYRDGKQKASVDEEGKSIESHYDRARRPTTITFKKSDGLVENTQYYTHDKRGNVTGVIDNSGNIVYVYDSLSRVTGEVQNAGAPASYTIQSEYDLSGLRTKIKYPSTFPTPETTIVQTYDPAGRLKAVNNAAIGVTHTYQYDKAGNVTRLRWPTDSDATYVAQTVNTYDALNRLQSRVASKRVGGTVFSASFGYDLVGNIRSLDETNNGQARNVLYEYDQQYRLTKESWGGHEYSYKYDRIGNRQELVHKYPQGGGQETDTYVYQYEMPASSRANQILAITLDGNSYISYEYDDTGNRTTKTVNGGTPTHYTWDVSNRLIEVKEGTSTVFQATYDYRTRRIRTIEGGNNTRFVYDGGLCMQEYLNTTANATNELTNGVGLGGGIGGVLYEVRNGTRSHFVYNQVGHNVVQLGSTGSVLTSKVYEAFGGLVGPSQQTANNRLANTRERDGSTGLYNHGFRYYDGSLGRYLSRDPIGYSGGYNLYIYAGCNPLTRFDPTGLDWETRVWGALKTVGGVLEAAAGAVLAGASGIATGVSAGAAAPVSVPAFIAGSAVFMHGADTAIAGLQEVGTGEPTRTVTSQALDYVTGSSQVSEQIDTALGVAGGVAVGVRTAAGVSRSAIRGSDCVAGAGDDSLRALTHAEAATTGRISLRGQSPARLVADGDGIRGVMPCAPQGSTAETTNLFRAVSQAEFVDLMKTGKFAAGPNSLGGKFFAENAADAAKWGERLQGQGKFRIVEAQLPANSANKLMRWDRLDAIGPARYGELDQLSEAIIKVAK